METGEPKSITCGDWRTKKHNVWRLENAILILIDVFFCFYFIILFLWLRPRYTEAGGGLPPHTDLARTDARGRTSKHTFILYLTDCHTGGTTVLLDRLPQPCTPIACVTPKRGRLFVFPHLCPHMAVAVDTPELPKIILRGEMV